MNDELKIIIDEYLENVANLCNILLQELGLRTKRELLLYLSENKIRELSIQGIHYQFQGKRCYARYDGKYINWDFGYRSRWCGIAPWCIAITLQENGSNYSKRFDREMIRKECERSLQNNEMFFVGGQYYFVIPMSETFKPDFPDEFVSLIIEYFDFRWEVRRNKEIDHFIRKSTWVYKGIEHIRDKYILRFMSNGKEIYSVPYCDIGYPDDAIEIMSDDIIINLMRAEINMKYLLIIFDNEKYWIELDCYNCAIRQIILDEFNVYHFSCLEDCLAEGIINEMELAGNVVKISKCEFEDVWRLVIENNKRKWEQIKKKYPIGKRTQGIFSYYYPQGTVIKGEDFVAICKSSKNFSHHELVKIEIKKYDDINMWLIVEDIGN